MHWYLITASYHIVFPYSEWEAVVLGPVDVVVVLARVGQTTEFASVFAVIFLAEETDPLLLFALDNFTHFAAQAAEFNPGKV